MRTNAIMKRASAIALLTLAPLTLWGSFKAVGKVTVAASGTPVQIYTSGSPNNLLLRASFITIAVAPDQTGPFIYVGDSTLNKSTRAGVALILTPGQSYTFQAGVEAKINPEEIFVDADHSGDSVQVSVVY